MSIEELKSKLEDLNFDDTSDNADNIPSDLDHFNISEDQFRDLASRVQELADERSNKYQESYEESIKMTSFQVARNSLGVGYDAKQVNQFAEMLAESIGYENVEFNHIPGAQESSDQYSYKKYYEEDQKEPKEEVLKKRDVESLWNQVKEILGSEKMLRSIFDSTRNSERLVNMLLEVAEDEDLPREVQGRLNELKNLAKLS